MKPLSFHNTNNAVRERHVLPTSAQIKYETCGQQLVRLITCWVLKPQLRSYLFEPKIMRIFVC